MLFRSGSSRAVDDAGVDADLSVGRESRGGEDESELGEHVLRVSYRRCCAGKCDGEPLSPSSSTFYIRRRPEMQEIPCLKASTSTIERFADRALPAHLDASREREASRNDRMENPARCS